MLPQGSEKNWHKVKMNFEIKWETFEKVAKSMSLEMRKVTQGWSRKSYIGCNEPEKAENFLLGIRVACQALILGNMITKSLVLTNVPNILYRIHVRRKLQSG
jgi:hypothetical protein